MGEKGSQWTHEICDECYTVFEPKREPLRAMPDEGQTLRNQEICCFCGDPNRSGIYYRYDPKRALCNGKHAWDKED